MSNTAPFRDMRTTLKMVKAQVALLLGIPGQEWAKEDYALFFILVDTKLENPTRRTILIHLGAWLRFYRRLIMSLPEGELRKTGLAEFYKISARWSGLLEEKKHE